MRADPRASGWAGPAGGAVFVSILVAAHTARGQCEPRWGSVGAAMGLRGTGAGAMYWPVGPSASPCVLVVGAFGSAGLATGPNAAAFDGERWIPVGSSFPGVTGGPPAMTLWDADGPGPQPPRPVVSTTTSACYRFDGVDWRAVSPQEFSRVSALGSWDPDGDGPQTPLLVLGGQFVFSVNGQLVTNIAAWDGTAVRRLGEGLNSTVNAIASWDPDGPGPLAPMLVAAGSFTRSGSATVVGVARWNGSAWEGMSLPAGSVGSRLLVRDPDGPGDAPAELIAQGSFGAALGGLIVQDQQGWRPLTGQPVSAPGRAILFDDDGVASTPERLVLYGNAITVGGATGSAVQWDGAAWSTLLSDPLPTGPSSDLVPLPAIPMTGGEPGFLNAGPAASGAAGFFAGVAVRRAGRWEPLGGGFYSAPRAMIPFDTDGPGPVGERLVVSGSPTALHLAAGLAEFDGASWSDDLGGSEYSIGGFASWDPDGAGPGIPRLAAILQRFGSDPPVREYVGYRSAGSWQLLTAGLDSYHTTSQYLALGVTPDDRLMLCGTMANFPISGAALWSGSSWVRAGVPFGDLSHLVLADVDGPGPLPVCLVGAGSRGIQDRPRVQRWTGTDWVALGSDLFPSSRVEAMIVGDLDGDGPLPPTVIIGGNLAFGHDATIRHVSYFGDGDWRPVGVAARYTAPVTALTMWDPDGRGPAPRQLVAGGRIAGPDGRDLGGLARWDGGEWRAIGEGIRRGPRSVDVAAPTQLTAWDPDGDGPGAERLYVLGDFGVAGGAPAGCFAWVEPAWCCPADFNADGFLDFFDYLEFVSCFEGVGCPPPGPLAADFNADGFVDFFDYGDFVAAFEAGC